MDLAPDFSLFDQDGEIHNLEDYRGSWLVLYFYPKDDTAGCTAEACSFRDAREELDRMTNVHVVGVSTDSVASHKKFAEKYHLTFTLLSDPEHKTVAAYESWRPFKMAGKEFFGTQRNTFVIDPDGKIVRKYEKVNPQDHVAQIMDDLTKLQS